MTACPRLPLATRSSLVTSETPFGMLVIQHHHPRSTWDGLFFLQFNFIDKVQLEPPLWQPINNRAERYITELRVFLFRVLVFNLNVSIVPVPTPKTGVDDLRIPGSSRL